MIKLLKYLKGSAIICAILAALTMCLEVAMDLLQPTLLSKIIDTGVANGDLNYVLYIGIQMVIAAVVGLIAGSACSYFAAVASMNLGQEVRQGLFDKIQTLSFVELDKLKTSSLITRLTNDITQVQMMMNMALRMMVRAPLTAIGGIIMAYILSPKLSTIFLIAIPIITVSVLFILKKSLPLFTKVQQNIDNVNTVMRESILGVKVIKAFAIENTQKSRFIEANEELTNTSIKSQNMNLILWPMATLIMNLTVVCVLWFGGNMVNAGDLEIGKIVAFINYLLQIMGSVVMVINIMIGYSRAKASATRINEVFETETSIKDKENTMIASEKVTIIDNPLLDNGLSSAPFDDEGVATFTKELVYEGKLNTLLHNLKTAHKQGVKSTGNGFKSSYASPISVSPTNFYIEPGTNSLEEIIKKINKGLIITDFAGLHSGANSITGDFSLAAKGFYIENGTKTKPVEQITVAGNFFALLKDVEEIGNDLKFPMSSVGSPSILIKELSIAGEGSDNE